MHSWEDIEENRCFSNGGTNLHIHAIAQGRPEDNQVEFLQGPHGIVNPPKNLVLNNIRRFTQMANGLKAGSWNAVSADQFGEQTAIKDWKRLTERHHVIPGTIGGTDRLISHISIRIICTRPLILSRSSKQL